MEHFDHLKAIHGGSSSAVRLEGGIETEDVNSLVSPGNEIKNDLDLNGYEISEEDCQTSPKPKTGKRKATHQLHQS